MRAPGTRHQPYRIRWEKSLLFNPSSEFRLDRREQEQEGMRIEKENRIER